jgi:3',5'-cyclic AMP phosphodiesterase CpdA
LTVLLAAAVGCNAQPAADPAPPTDAPAAPERPRFSFGVVADVQYADKAGGARRYRESIDKVARCVEAWNREDLAFVVELGDLTDDRPDGGTQADLGRILDAFKPLRAPLRHVLGNHGQPSAGRTAVMDALGLERPYYDFAVDGWRFVILDGTGLHLKAWPADTARRAASEAYVREHRKPDAPEFAEYNGGIDPDQLAWLREILAKAAAADEPAVVLCHQPVLAAASSRSHLLWNHEEVLALLEACPTLVAYIAGHDHRGGYAERAGIHHVTLEGLVETPADGTAFGVVDVRGGWMTVRGGDPSTPRRFYQGLLEIRGTGAVTSRVLKSNIARFR